MAEAPPLNALSPCGGHAVHVTGASTLHVFAVGVDAAAHLHRFDSHGFWSRLEDAVAVAAAAAAVVEGDTVTAGRHRVVGRGGIVTTGPTGTNVADVIVVACG
jgi:glycerate-2-kinase